MHTNKALGRLEKSPVRDIWPDEARNFTPWLAQEENIALLSETIGIELEVEGQEQAVGPFKADILCKDADSNDDHFVLIENQLEKTNHTHLGQLMTYAAGLQAVSIVWIADRFTDEHRAALDWLNEITAEDFRFFGLEIEVWRIGESIAAPKFNIVSKPNDWSAGVSRGARQVADGELSETKQMQLEYWTTLWAFLEAENSFLRGNKPRPRHWMNFAAGRSKFTFSATVNTQKNRLGVELNCKGKDALAHFELLRDDRKAIEQELGSELDWLPLPHRVASRIILYKTGVDPSNKNDWPNQHRWFKENLEAFNRVFRNRVRDLSADDYEPDEEGES